MKKEKKKHTSAKPVKRTNHILWITVIVIGLLAVGIFYNRSQVKNAAQANQTAVEENEESGNHGEYEEPGPEKEVVTIKITNNGFEPATIRVKAASHVIAFENMDTRVHSVKADPTEQQEFNTGPIAPGQQMSVVEYTEPGTYTYSDDENSTAKGTIIVEK